MRRIFILTIAAMWAALAGHALDTMAGSNDEYIKSAQVELIGSPMSPPVIVLNSNDVLLFKFDHLSDDREYFRYDLVHCDANWQPSQLVENEYLDGFNQGIIDYYDYSQLTTTHYVHYEMTIPNSEVSPTKSGNYLLRVYQENDPDQILLQYRFMVSEQTALIDSEVTTRTDVDFNKKHQQLSVAVDSERSNVRDPFNDITIAIQQNGRYDNEIALRQPLRMASRCVSVYEHVPKLIFEAGNEYRRMETVSVTYPTMGVDEIEYHEPYYHITLQPDQARSDEMYLYDQTQHGRYTIREYNSTQSDIEADYVVVHFVLDIDEMPDAMIFLDGDFVDRRFDPNSLMTYNRATRRYERNMLLKQGAYNYQYLVVPSGASRGYTEPIEGDKYQTINEYLIKVYARNPGERYDRLIGVSTIYSN